MPVIANNVWHEALRDLNRNEPRWIDNPGEINALPAGAWVIPQFPVANPDLVPQAPQPAVPHAPIPQEPLEEWLANLPDPPEPEGEGDVIAWNPVRLRWEHWSDDLLEMEHPNWRYLTWHEWEAHRFRQHVQELERNEARVNEPVRPDPRKDIPEKEKKLPRFKPIYENREEAKLRLVGTIITLYDTPCYISDVGTVIDTVTNEQGLGAIVTQPGGRTIQVVFNPHGMDMRSPEPGYVTMDSSAYYMIRRPARVARQGLSKENVTLKLAGDKNFIGIPRPFTLINLAQALAERDVVRWTPQIYADLLNPMRPNSRRLSNRIAIYNSSKKGPSVEFKGRTLGPLENDTALVAELDAEASWIMDAMTEVGLNMQVK
jgi:hypothetical protein